MELKEKTRFGKLVVVQKINATWIRCKCDCGTICNKRASNLRKGHTKSCGCARKERMSKIGKIHGGKMKRHGMAGNGKTSKDPTYASWIAMRDRCRTQKHKSYQNAAICKFLYEDPKNLVETIGGRPGKEYSLDRFPISNGNYSCGQCPDCAKNKWQLNIRWATPTEQAENKINVRMMTAFGKTLPMAKWEEISGMDTATIRYRVLIKGWSMEKALATPNRQGYCYKGE